MLVTQTSSTACILRVFDGNLQNQWVCPSPGRNRWFRNDLVSFCCSYKEGDLSRPIGRKRVGRQGHNAVVTTTTTTTTTTTDKFDLLYFADPFFNDVVLRPLGEVFGFPPRGQLRSWGGLFT